MVPGNNRSFLESWPSILPALTAYIPWITESKLILATQQLLKFLDALDSENILKSNSRKIINGALPGNTSVIYEEAFNFVTPGLLYHNMYSLNKRVDVGIINGLNCLGNYFLVFRGCFIFIVDPRIYLPESKNSNCSRINMTKSVRTVKTSFRVTRNLSNIFNEASTMNVTKKTYFYY